MKSTAIRSTRWLDDWRPEGNNSHKSPSADKHLKVKVSGRGSGAVVKEIQLHFRLVEKELLRQRESDGQRQRNSSVGQKGIGSGPWPCMPAFTVINRSVPVEHRALRRRWQCTTPRQCLSRERLESHLHAPLYSPAKGLRPRVARSRTLAPRQHALVVHSVNCMSIA